MAHNIVDPPAAHEAVLSQSSRQHLQDFVPAHPPPLDQARHHPHVLHYLRLQLARSGLRFPRRIRRPSSFLPALPVLDSLLLPALLGAVISGAAARGIPLAVDLAAAKGTTQVLATGVAWMGEEEYPAMPAALQAPSQVGLGSQNRPQDDVILKDETAGLAPAVPVRPELKTPLDPYCKKPRFSLMMLMDFVCLLPAGLLRYI